MKRRSKILRERAHGLMVDRPLPYHYHIALRTQIAKRSPRGGRSVPWQPPSAVLRTRSSWLPSHRAPIYYKVARKGAASSGKVYTHRVGVKRFFFFFSFCFVFVSFSTLDGLQGPRHFLPRRRAKDKIEPPRYICILNITK